MKIWKVILATLVIFSAGVLAGGLVVKSFQPLPQMVRQTNAVPERWMQKMLLERMKADLNLTPEQKQRVERIFAESQERMSVLWDIINPEIQTELREVREKIRAELRPDQLEKFEQLLKRPPQRRPEGETNKVRRPKSQSGDGANSGKPPKGHPSEGPVR